MNMEDNSSIDTKVNEKLKPRINGILNALKKPKTYLYAGIYASIPIAAYYGGKELFEYLSPSDHGFGLGPREYRIAGLCSASIAVALETLLILYIKHKKRRN